MQITHSSTIGELVAEDHRLAQVFKKFDIDFCCNGQRTVGDACARKELDPEVLIRALEDAMQSGNSGQPDYRSWPPDLLIDYIEKKHHRYVTEQLAEIQPFLDKLCRVHGAPHPELFQIRDLFVGMAADLSVHMKKEELVLFPYIRRLVDGQRLRREVPEPHFGTVQNPVAMMRAEHEHEGERLTRIAALSGNYTPPEDACNTYRVTFKLLRDFEEDLHQHIHLENNILFPAALRMEQDLHALA